MATSVNELNFSTKTFDPKYYLGANTRFVAPIRKKEPDDTVEISTKDEPKNDSKNDLKNNNDKRLKALKRTAYSMFGVAAIAATVGIVSFIKARGIDIRNLGKSPKQLAIDTLNKYLEEKLPKNAGVSEIREAYKKLAKKYHPDARGASKIEGAEDIFKEISLAYNKLTKPPKK